MHLPQAAQLHAGNFQGFRTCSDCAADPAAVHNFAPYMMLLVLNSLPPCGEPRPPHPHIIVCIHFAIIILEQASRPLIVRTGELTSVLLTCTTA